MKNNRTGIFILVSLLALSSLACSLSGLIPGVGGSSGSATTVTDLWPDVPKMDGITVIKADMPIEFQIAVQAFFAAASSNQGSINFIAYTTDKTPADVEAYYSAERMKSAGWDVSPIHLQPHHPPRPGFAFLERQTKITLAPCWQSSPLWTPPPKKPTFSLPGLT